MTRLSLRLFLSFWLVVVLTVGALWAINGYLGRLQQDDQTWRERGTVLREALAPGLRGAWQEGGEAALRDWLREVNATQRALDVYVLDADGHDLLGRTPPRQAQRAHRRWLAGPQAGRTGERGRMGRVLQVEDREYLLVVVRERTPVLLRVLGPLGPLGLFALAVAFSGLVSFALARHFTRPIRQMRHVGQELGHGRLDARLEDRFTRRRDELGDLARDFNRMAARVEQLLAAQRQLLRDVSHELRSPLARMQVSLTLASDATSDAERERHLDRIATEAERLGELIGQILTYSRIADAGALRTEAIDLDELLAHAVEAARVEGGPRGVTVETRGATGCEVHGDAELLHRAVDNVLRNAIRHSPDGGCVTVEVRVDAACVTVSVADRGPGVPETQLARIFEPFVRLSPERGERGSGGGVGLAITARAMERHGGGVRATNRPGGGLEVCLTLPLAAAGGADRAADVPR